MAYGAVREGKCYLVVDGEDLGPFDDLGTRTGYCSAGGERLAFVALVEGKVRVTVDGSQQPPCHDVGDLEPAPMAARGLRGPGAEGRSLVGRRRRRETAAVRHDRRRLAPVQPRQCALVYAAQKQVAGWPSSMASRATPTTVSPRCCSAPTQAAGLRGRRRPDGGGRGRRPNRALSTRSAAARSCSAPTAAVSATSRAAAGARFVVIDALRKSRYTMVGFLTFSPDGRHHAYTAARQDGRLHRGRRARGGPPLRVDLEPAQARTCYSTTAIASTTSP